MTEERQTGSMDEGNAGTPGDAAAPAPKSVEEVEAFYRYRQSQADKAHAAETAALNAQIAALKATPVAPSVDETPEQVRVRELEATLAQEREARQAAELRSAYPQTASVLGEYVTKLPPEKLAAIEAMGSQEEQPGRIMDTNSAPRPMPGTPGTAGAKPTNEKSKAELLADLQRIAPVYQQAQKEGLL